MVARSKQASEQGKLRVERVSIGTLTLDPANARRHGDRNLEAIRGSLARFGQQKPIVVGRDGVVVAGNGTLEAARALGWTELEVVRTDLAGADRAAFAIADNRTGELATWDEAVLAELLGPLDPALVAAAGFTDAELAELLEHIEAEAQVGNPAEDPGAELDRAEELQVKWGTTLGQVWQMGSHRILCGDCTEAEAWQRLAGGKRAAICWTDPPWNVAYGKAEHPTWRRRTITNDDLGRAFPAFAAAFVQQIRDHLVDGGPLYLAMSAQEWPTIHGALSAGGFHWSSTIIWAKDRLVLSRKDYHTQYEPIWYGWKEPGPRLCPLLDRTQSDLWEIPRPAASEEHPTMKPVELVRRAIQNSSVPGAVVLDPFAGSGSTLVASEQAGRACWAIELEPKYVAVTIERLAGMGLHPELLDAPQPRS